jgi:hypothetical protein
MLLPSPICPLPVSVAFDIASSTESNDMQSWSATYGDSGKVARFRIELDRKQKPMGNGVLSGDGRLLSQPASDASAFLEKLKTSFEAKGLPKKVAKVQSLPFKFVVLGEHLSQASEGGFFMEPPGNWIAMKIFLADGKAEVFLDLNPAIGKGEFLIKDPDYGDAVLAELAKVL